MLGPLLFACFVLAVAGVLSKVFVGRWLEEGKEKVNDAQLAAQQTATQRRQNEELLNFEEGKERRLRGEHHTLVEQVENLKKRLGGSTPA